MGRGWATAIPGLFGAAAIAVPGVAEACRLALVLAFDVSASVDAAEYRLQAGGTAAALVSPAVRAAVLVPGPPVAIAATMWSGADEQSVVSDWVVVDGPDALERLAGRIASHPRPDFGGRTAIGAALAQAGALLARAPGCDRQVIDVSGDGEANDGPAPRGVRRGGALAGVTINALVVGGDLPLDHGFRAEEGGMLTDYFTREVIQGQGAFVESADDYRDFEAAMTRKLLREIQGMMIGAAPG